VYKTCAETVISPQNKQSTATRCNEAFARVIKFILWMSGGGGCRSSSVNKRLETLRAMNIHTVVCAIFPNSTHLYPAEGGGAVSSAETPVPSCHIRRRHSSWRGEGCALKSRQLLSSSTNTPPTVEPYGPLPTLDPLVSHSRTYFFTGHFNVILQDANRYLMQSLSSRFRDWKIFLIATMRYTCPAHQIRLYLANFIPAKPVPVTARSNE